MDFATNNSSSSSGGSSQRWGLGLRTIGKHLLAQLDIISNGVPDHESTVVIDTPSLCQHLEPHANPLPLGRIPEEVCLNVFSFLTAKELCAVRGASSDFLQTADRHGEVLWGHLCLCDFPSVSRGAQEGRSAHQQYIINVIHRANEEAGNLRATQRIRESLETYYSSNKNKKHDGNGGCMIGLVSDLGTISDGRIARAVSHKRRAAMSTLVVTDENVIYDFRRCGLYTGPLNFLPLRTLQLEHPAPTAQPTGGGGGGGLGGSSMLLPPAPETPAPTGFLGYAVCLVRLRPQHEFLRWTVLFALFKDMAVFETTEQAEAVRARAPNQRLFYCALDHPGAQDDPCVPGGRVLPHIGHWGFRPLFVGGGGWIGGGGGNVAHAAERLERTACFARSSLAFLQYGGGVGPRVQACAVP